MQVVLYDTETTDLVRNSGLPLEKQPRIIELFAKKIQLPADGSGNADEWRTVDQYEHIFNPGIPIPDEVVKITGIDDSMVKNEDRIKDHWPEICEFFEGVDHDVAHNLSYDRSMIDFEQKRYDPNAEFPFPKKGICTVEGTVHLKGHRLNLQALHVELFGKEFEKAHRARNDVMAMERCFKKLYEIGEI